MKKVNSRRKGKRVDKQNLLIKGETIGEKPEDRKTPEENSQNNPYKQNDPKSRLRIENRSYDNKNPTLILIPIPISVSPPITKEPRTITISLYSKFENLESKTKNQRAKTQESRTMSLYHTISLYSIF